MAPRPPNGPRRRPKGRWKGRPVVIKHSAAVHVRGNIGFAERKVWTALLQNAYDGLADSRTHTIRAADLIGRTGLNTANYDYLKDVLTALASTPVVWDGMNQAGGEVWEVSAMLAAARLEGGVVTYAFSPFLQEKLSTPSIYARYFLEMMLAFKCRYAYVLYETCCDYTWNRDGDRKNVVETPWVPLETFRANFGVPEGTYARFAELRRNVLDPAFAEVNEISEFEVSYELRRLGRSYSHVKFSGVRRPGSGAIQLSMLLDE